VKRDQEHQETACAAVGCGHLAYCSTLRGYVADRAIGGENDGYWCPCAPAHRNTLARAGITLPRADGTFDPGAIARAKDAFAAGCSRDAPGITLGEIIAWRVWIVRDGLLLSPFREMPWPAREVMAGDCAAGFGIFAFKDQNRAVDEARRMATPGLTIAYGAVRLWGKVVEHRRGYRAEFARIATLDGVFPTDQSLAQIRRRYGIEASV
jgi:hypothetical protein